MNIFIESHKILLQKLIEAGVDFILIGGYSVIYHGYKRTTGDMDIWLKPDNENKAKLAKALKAVGFNTEDLSVLNEIDLTKHTVFSIWDDPEKVDFITIINLVDYDAANNQKILGDIDGLQVPVLHLNDLILSKMNTGRLQDKADIEKLQEIQKTKKK